MRAIIFTSALLSIACAVPADACDQHGLWGGGGNRFSAFSNIEERAPTRTTFDSTPVEFQQRMIVSEPDSSKEPQPVVTTMPLVQIAPKPVKPVTKSALATR